MGSGEGLCPPIWGSGACPRKKNQFCAKNYAILSKFWYFFPILQHKNLPVHQRKWWDYPLSPKSGGTYPPVPPPAPTPMGTTSESEVGRGSAAAVILRPDSVDEALKVREVLNRIVDSIEAEISAVALALEASAELFRRFVHLYYYYYYY